MEFYLHIKPQFDCAIKTQTFSDRLNENRLYSYLVSTDENILTLSFYPINNDEVSLPFSTAILLDKQKLNSRVTNIDLIKFPHNSLLMIVRPKQILYPKPFNIKTKIVNFANQSHTLYYSKNDKFTVRIENQDLRYIDIDFDKKIIDLNTKSVNDKLFIYSKTSENTFITCLLSYKNKEYEILKLEEVNLLESDKNEILTYKNANDFCHHGVVCKYNFDKEFKFEKDLVYNENQPFYTHQKELIPYAFLDAVKIKNYDLAREYLSSELSNKLKDNHLSRFFGNFLFSHQSLCKDNNINEIALIYEKDDEKYAKIYSFDINSDNKITNITLL